MRRINYKVDIDDSKLKNQISDRKNTIDNIIASIIYKRKERICYEKSTIESINLEKMQRENR